MQTINIKKIVNVITNIVLISFAGYSFSVIAEPFTADEFDFTTKCNTHSHNKKYKDGFQEIPTMQCIAYSKMGRFRVRYDTTGINAVERTDKDNNGIPDYIDSVCAVFDYVYEIEVVQMGMERPRTDYKGDAPNNPYYDIVVVDFAETNSPTYGITYSLKEEYGIRCFFSYIVIDNNYSANDTYKDGSGNIKKLYATTGIDGLKVTAAHEFHHSIQYAIGNIQKCNNSIYEMSAVCMEILVYPNLYDYINYVNALLANIYTYIFGKGEADNGYPFGIFFYMLTEKYGIDIIQNYFKLANKVNNCYQGLDSILVLNNSSLKSEWMEFMKWIYHSGKNAIVGQYFPMASKFRTPVPTNTLQNYGLNTNELYPYQLVYTRFINSNIDPFIQPDTVELFFTNAGTQEAIAGENNCFYQAITCNARSSETEIIDGEKIFDDFWLKIFSTSPNMDYLLITKAGGKVDQITHCYPMPYNKTIHKHLCFPIADDVIVGEKLKLTIYNANNISVFSGIVETAIDNQHRVLKYNPDTLNSGVYTFTISRGGTDLVGKIVIK